MKLSEILKKEEIYVKENKCEIVERGSIDFSNIESPKNFNSTDYKSNYEISDPYSYSYPTYTVFKKHTLLFNNLNEDELIEFFESLMKKCENK